MKRDDKRFKFNLYRGSLIDAGLSTKDDDALICPLCWQETPYTDLSLEHVVPGSVGGKQRILTCFSCNNEDGRDLDAHLSRYQAFADAVQGYGTLRTKLSVNDNEVVANLEWGEGKKTFTLVPKASNPKALAQMQKHCADGTFDKMDFTLFFNYSKNNFQTAVLRAAYLIAFKCYGYWWARHDVVQTVRRRIEDPSLEVPRVTSLVFECQDVVMGSDSQHYAIRGNVDGVEFLLVIIRVRKQTTTYHGAYLPMPAEGSDSFFELMEQVAKEQNGGAVSIPESGMFA